MKRPIFDRLCDFQPLETEEAESQLTISKTTFLNSVKREIQLIVDHRQDLIARDDDFLNYGCVDFQALFRNKNISVEKIEEYIAHAIMKFEPRIVGVKVSSKINWQENTIYLSVEGQVRVEEEDTTIYLKFEL